jgi:hypothetical protein
MATVAEQIVGRAAELETLDKALGELERRRSAALDEFVQGLDPRRLDGLADDVRRNLFFKLSVSSRVEIARAVERAECELGAA